MPKITIQNPKVLAVLIIGLAGGIVWWTQYYVDYEVSLLPWLAGRGWMLYRDMVDQHSPLFTWFLSFMGGGGPGLPLHVVIVALNVLTLSLIYFVAARLAGAVAGLLALTLAAVWLVSFDGTHLWFDGALAPVYLGVMACAERAVQSAREESKHARVSPACWVFAVGLLLSVGVLIKQHALLAVPFALAWVWSYFATNRFRFTAWLVLGFALPVLVGVGIFALQGSLADAWYWIVNYSLTSDYAGASRLAPVAGEWPVLAVVYAPGVLALLMMLIKLKRDERFRAGLPVLMAGLLVAATAPAWPRYSRFHLQAAVPLLAVAGGVGIVLLWGAANHDHENGWSWGRLRAVVGLLVLAITSLAGAQQWVQTLFVYNQFGSPQAPYASTIGPLRAWVDSSVSPGESIFAYDLDSLIYRVLEREPTRPFVPQLSWVLAARESESRLWEGVGRAEPTVVLAPAEWWASNTPGRAGMEGMLRLQYHEGGRFGLVSYPGARRVDVVGLLRNGNTGNTGITSNIGR